MTTTELNGDSTFRQENRLSDRWPTAARRLCNICNDFADHQNKITPCLTCYRSDISRSRSNQKLVSAGAWPLVRGRAWPLTNTLLPTWVTVPNLILVGQTVRAWVWRSSEKLCSSRPTFQGHPRSSELTQIDLVPMTSY